MRVTLLPFSDDDDGETGADPSTPAHQALVPGPSRSYQHGLLMALLQPCYSDHVRHDSGTMWKRGRGWPVCPSTVAPDLADERLDNHHAVQLHRLPEPRICSRLGHYRF